MGEKSIDEVYGRIKKLIDNGREGVIKEYSDRKYVFNILHNVFFGSEAIILNTELSNIITNNPNIINMVDIKNGKHIKNIEEKNIMSIYTNIRNHNSNAIKNIKDRDIIHILIINDEKYISYENRSISVKIVDMITNYVSAVDIDRKVKINCIRIFLHSDSVYLDVDGIGKNFSNKDDINLHEDSILDLLYEFEGKTFKNFDIDSESSYRTNIYNYMLKKMDNEKIIYGYNNTDELFKSMCKDILNNGTSTEGYNVRPKWDDGTPAHTIRRVNVVNRYDLSKEFPILTLRPVPLKLCVDEILWIWQKKSNNVKDLNSSVWDEWTDDNGTIGKAYGYQLAKVYKTPYGMMDQVDTVLYQLKNDPFSTRIITNMYNHEELTEMGLAPCAYSMTFNVTLDEEGNKVLNTLLNQRSQDVLTANGWNVTQYAILTHMFARACDMKVGIFTHVIANAHIYDRHIPSIQKLLKHPSYKAPKLIINPDVKDFYEFTVDDFKLGNYHKNNQLKNIPVAI